MSSIDELITTSIEAAAADPAWLGSSGQLGVLAESLPGFGVENATVVWAAQGRQSNWTAATRTIEIERVASGAIPRSDDVIATLTARGVLHECLHARYSTPWSLRRQLAMTLPPWRPLIETLANILEDARIARAAGVDEPELAAANTDHLQAAVDQFDDRSGTSGSGAKPASKQSQLVFGVMAYALAPDREVMLHPDVAAALDELRPIINGARDGARSEVCVNGAAELVDAVRVFSAAIAHR
jgi:hypothetical protein